MFLDLTTDDGSTGRRWFVAGLVLGIVVGNIVTVGILVGVIVTARGADDRVDHVHASQLFTRPRSELAAELARFRRADVVTWTEVGNRASTLRRPDDGWSTYAAPRRTDVAVSWRRVWRPRARGVALLSSSRYWRARGPLAPRQRAAWVVLDRDDARVFVVVAHLPAHVQLGDVFRPGVPFRVRVWRESVDELAAIARRAVRRWRPDLVVVAADWNVDVRRPVWRRYLLDRFDGLRLTWRRPLPSSGTHRGGRLIDATLTDGRGRARLLARTSSSDHRAYAERLRPSTSGN